MVENILARTVNKLKFPPQRRSTLKKQILVVREILMQVLTLHLAYCIHLKIAVTLERATRKLRS
uniref:Uncharacterized protein n=1 Tax=Arundo donax TaxID=35708 RepID=A0A0A8ZPW0_ARUDO